MDLVITKCNNIFKAFFPYPKICATGLRRDPLECKDMSMLIRKIDHQSVMLEQMNKKLNLLTGSLPVIAPNSFLTAKETIQPDPNIILPRFPLHHSEEVTVLEARLSDPAFFNAMVILLFYHK